MYERLESTKNDSDLAYFYDLLLLGEQLTKIVTLFLVSASIVSGNAKKKLKNDGNLCNYH